MCKSEHQRLDFGISIPQDPTIMVIVDVLTSVSVSQNEKRTTTPYLKDIIKYHMKVTPKERNHGCTLSKMFLV